MDTVHTVQQELTDLLFQEGARLVGVADLENKSQAVLPVGIAVAIPLPAAIIHSLIHFPTKEYYDVYQEYNQRLNQIVLAGERYLHARGFRAQANTTDRVQTDEKYCTHLPHKTVATRAGLGWIGKSCLLVTPEFGSAVRLSSLLTDAPFVCRDPVLESRCGTCSACVNSCPGNALKGTL